MYCPNCACELPAVARFCVRCGAPTGVSPVAAAEPPISKPQPPARADGPEHLRDHAYCGRCGARITGGNEFCRACGNPRHIDDVHLPVATPTHSTPSDVRVVASQNVHKYSVKEREQLSLSSDQSELESVTSQDKPTQPRDEKRPLVSRESWIVCSILSLLAAISNASKSGATGSGEFVPFAIGGFIGALILFAGSWAVMVLVFRWISGWISRMRHKHPTPHSANQQTRHVSSPSMKKPRLRAYWLVPVALVALILIWAFGGNDTHFVTGPAASSEIVSHIKVTGTLPDVVVLDGSNEAPNERYRFGGHVFNDSRSEISFIRMRIRIFACGATPQPEDTPLTQEERSSCTEVGESVREVYARIGPGETGDFGNFYFPKRPRNYGWDFKILKVETPSGG